MSFWASSIGAVGSFSLETVDLSFILPHEPVVYWARYSSHSLSLKSGIAIQGAFSYIYPVDLVLVQMKTRKNPRGPSFRNQVNTDLLINDKYTYSTGHIFYLIFDRFSMSTLRKPEGRI